MLKFDDTKTGKRRVPINSHASQVLRALPRALSNDLVFQSAKVGGQLSLTRPWYRIRDLAQIDSTATIHSLRHTFASWSVMGGLSLPQVGAMLGHKSAQTTLRYADHLQESVRQYCQQTGDLIVGIGQADTDQIRKSKSVGEGSALVVNFRPQ